MSRSGSRASPRLHPFGFMALIVVGVLGTKLFAAS